MWFDRFDICEAYWIYADQYHEGMWSDIYRIFGRLNRIGFSPAPSLSEDSLTENGQAILQSLIERKHLSASEKTNA